MSMACDLCGQKKISGGAKGVVATRSASALIRHCSEVSKHK